MKMDFKKNNSVLWNKDFFEDFIQTLRDMNQWLRDVRRGILADQRGFQLLDLIITELISYMTCYNSMPLVEITAFRLDSKSCKGFYFDK